MMVNGMQVFADTALPEFKEVKIRERKWARRVMFERYRRFDVKRERMIIAWNGSLFCHPNTLAEIEKATVVFRFCRAGDL